MKIILMALLTFTCSLVWAEQINCVASHHYLVFFADGSAETMDRTYKDFSIEYVPGKLNFYETTLKGRKIGTLTGTIRSPKDEIADGFYFEGVHTAILDSKNEDKLETSVSLNENRVRVTSTLQYQPAQAVGEIFRHEFWISTCHWKASKVYKGSTHAEFPYSVHQGKSVKTGKIY